MSHAAGAHYVSPQGGKLGAKVAHTPGAAGGGHAGKLLKVGSSGSAVEKLQRDLINQGFTPGPIDGFFGELTRMAVLDFQRAKGLQADGIVGPKTQAALDLKPTGPSERQRDASAKTGPLLQMGEVGPYVAELQRMLAERGFDPGPIDGQFGAGTRKAVIQFQRAKALAPDGIVGKHTWAALGVVTSAPKHNPGSKPPKEGPPHVDPGHKNDGKADGGKGNLRADILAVARSQLGTKESGWNGGASLKYQHYFNRGPEPWCADFVSWVYTHAGKKMNDPYCPSIVNTLKKSGRWKTSNPEPGDLVLFDWDGDGKADHVGIVEHGNKDGTVTTIEGNTSNPKTGQEGVWERRRDRDTILGYGKLQ